MILALTCSAVALYSVVSHMMHIDVIDVALFCIFRSLPSNDLIDWNSGLSIRMYVSPSIHKFFFWILI